MEISKRIGLGCANIAGMHGPVDRDVAMDALSAAWDLGIRHYDTAPFYGRGLSERRVGDFLRDKSKSEYVLTTKVGRRLAARGGAEAVRNEPTLPLPFKIEFDYSYDGIMRSVEDSFQRLGHMEIDVLYVHDLGRFAHGKAADGHFRTFMESGLRALVDLKAQGVISGYGLGVNENEVCIDVLSRAPLDQILLAGRYTLLDRSAEVALLPLCLKHGTKIVLGGVFNSGILATGAKEAAWFNYAPASEDVRRRVDAIEAITSRYGISLAQAALNFPLAHPAISSILIGTHKKTSLERNLAILGVPLPEDMLDEILPFVLRDGF